LNVQFDERIVFNKY